MQTRNVATIVALAAALLIPSISRARDPHRTVESAGNVLKEFLDLQVKGIPASLLAEAHGVAIVPDVIKVGLVLGGQRGKGLVIIREKDGSWRAPTFVTLTGGSVGWQIGAQSTDFVLVFKTQKSVEGLMKGKFTIGADAAAAAGPVGRRAGASTDGELKAEIYTYSRTRGLFAGVSLDGSVLDVDEETNAAYYGGFGGNEGAPLAPEAAIKLTQLIAQLTANPELIDGRAPSQAVAGERLPTPAGRRNATEDVPYSDGPALVPMEPTPADPNGRRFVQGIPLNSLPSADGFRPTQPQPQAVDAETVQRELARSARQLAALLDRNWQRYLELPDEIYRQGKRPSGKSLEGALNRFDTVAKEARYQSLIERPEFQATHDWLRAYAQSLEAASSPKLSLPPPPAGQR